MAREVKIQASTVVITRNLFRVQAPQWVGNRSRWDGTSRSERDEKLNGPAAERPDIYIIARRFENGPYQYSRIFAWKKDGGFNHEIVDEVARRGWEVIRELGTGKPKKFSGLLDPDAIRAEMVKHSTNLYPEARPDTLRTKLREATYVDNFIES